MKCVKNIFLSVWLVIIAFSSSNAQVTPVSDSVINPYQVVITGDAAFHYFVEDTVKYTYEMIEEDIYYFQKHWPQYVTVKTIGESEFGLPMTSFRISNGKPKSESVFYVGNIHAREDYSSKMVMKFANVFLLSLDGLSSIYPNAKQLLNEVDLHFLPVANPDGLKIAHEQFGGIEDSVKLWIDSVFCVEGFAEWKANARGIDLNSSFDDGNWPVKKGGAFQDCRASEGFKGDFPAEPKETRALQSFVDSLKPLTTVSFHTKGNVLFWADAKTHFWFDGIDTEMATEVEKETVFRAATVAKYPSDYGCGLENYVRNRIAGIGVCVELSDGGGGRKQHPDNQFNSQAWLKAWRIPMIYLENTVEHKEQLKIIQQLMQKSIQSN
jgi:Zinc carboxypeptidase